jgi:hypothetical protein
VLCNRISADRPTRMTTARRPHRAVLTLAAIPLVACAPGASAHSAACPKQRLPATLVPVSASWGVRYPTLTPGRVDGQVVLSDTAARPILASVTFSPASGPPRVRATGLAGDFAFDSIAPGRYVLSVRRLGYRAWRDTVVVRPDSGVRIVAVLARDTVTLCPVQLVLSH